MTIQTKLADILRYPDNYPPELVAEAEREVQRLSGDFRQWLADSLKPPPKDSVK